MSNAAATIFQANNLQLLHFCKDLSSQPIDNFFRCSMAPDFFKFYNKQLQINNISVDKLTNDKKLL